MWFRVLPFNVRARKYKYSTTVASATGPGEIHDLEDESTFWGAFWEAARVAAAVTALGSIGAAVDAALALLPELERPAGLSPKVDADTLHHLREHLEATRRHLGNAMEPLRPLVGHKLGTLREPAKVKVAALRAAFLRQLEKRGVSAPSRARWLRVLDEGANLPGDLETSESRRRSAAEYVRRESAEAADLRAQLKRESDAEASRLHRDWESIRGARASVMSLIASSRARHLGDDNDD